MGGITVAHHESNDSFSRRKSLAAESVVPPVMTEEQLNQLLAGTTPSDLGAPGLEDLTGEVQNLMMSEWLDPWSSASNTPSPGDLSPTDLTEFDAHQLSLQLESFFSQDPSVLEGVQSPFYDEMTFVPDNNLLNAVLSPTTTEQLPLLEEQQQQPLVIEQPQQLPQEEDIVEVEEDVTLQTLDMVVPMVEQQEQKVQPIEQQQPSFELPMTSLKRRRDSSSSESSCSSSSSSESESEDEEDDVIPTTVANVNNRQRYWSDSSDSDSEDENPTPHRSRASSPLIANNNSAYAYMHKRQIEETLLSKITNQLQQDKLPGILAILSSENKGEDEVEIDLSRLQREQLVRLLCYVEACIGEQNGGPAVNVTDYIVKETPVPKKASLTSDDDDEDDEESVVPCPNKSGGRRRRPAGAAKRGSKQQRKSRQELTEDILAGSEDDSDMGSKEVDDDLAGLRGQGPMSMAELSKRQDKARAKKTRKRVKKQSKDDAPVVSSTAGLTSVNGSIAASKPKRSSAQRKNKRGASSDDSDEELGRRSNNSSGSELIVYGNEQMDFNVKSNETIVHEPSPSTFVASTPVVPIPVPVVDDDEDLDEEIDIMM